MDHELDATNEMKSMMKQTHKDVLLDKSMELNDSMTINENSRDEYEQKIHSLGGQQ